MNTSQMTIDIVLRRVRERAPCTLTFRTKTFCEIVFDLDLRSSGELQEFKLWIAYHSSIRLTFTVSPFCTNQDCSFDRCVDSFRVHVQVWLANHIFMFFEERGAHSIPPQELLACMLVSGTALASVHCATRCCGRAITARAFSIFGMDFHPYMYNILFFRCWEKAASGRE